MSTSTLFRRSSRWRKNVRGHEAEAGSREKQTRQPMSDGSEEFFDEFTPENRNQREENHTRDVLVGLGITVGLVLGVGATLWLRKRKGARRNWRRWLD